MKIVDISQPNQSGHHSKEHIYKSHYLPIVDFFNVCNGFKMMTFFFKLDSGRSGVFLSVRTGCERIVSSDASTWTWIGRCKVDATWLWTAFPDVPGTLLFCPVVNHKKKRKHIFFIHINKRIFEKENTNRWEKLVGESVYTVSMLKCVAFGSVVCP